MVLCAGRVCEILPDTVINDKYLEPLLQALVAGMATEPRVASNVCWVRDSWFCYIDDFQDLS